MKFGELVNEITKRGYEWHRERIVENTRLNAPYIKKSVRDISPDPSPVLIVSAGPSLYRENVLKRIYGQFKGTIIATDGAYVQCLRAGIVPNYVVTLDPHPTRMVRWFGDPEYERNSDGDDYFNRQDLDIAFRENAAEENAKNIALVDRYKVPLVIGTTAPQNVVARTADFDRYWFAPLVDSPSKDGLTREMVRLSGVPAMNTGGTVGTAAWVFAHAYLKAPYIGVVGMDFGYYMDTPFDKTQSYHMLKDYQNISEFYPHYTGPWGETYTDPSYWWYRENFLDLLKANRARIINASGAGLLFGEGVGCMELEQWLAFCS